VETVEGIWPNHLFQLTGADPVWPAPMPYGRAPIPYGLCQLSVEDTRPVRVEQDSRPLL